MKTVELSAYPRKLSGKAGLKAIRKAEQVPGVIYGSGEPRSIAVDYVPFDKVLSTPETYIFHLDVEGTQVKAVIRELQFHPVTDKILHVDFLRVDGKNSIEVELPIRLTGTPKGVMNGGKLVQMLRKIRVAGVPNQLPEAVEVNVTALTLGKTIKVSDVEVEGLTITSPADAGIAAVVIPRAVKTGGAIEDEEEDEESEDGGEEGAEGGEE